MKKQIFKVIGMTVSVAGFVLSLIGDWAAEQEQDIIIEEKVNELLEKKNKEDK